MVKRVRTSVKDSPTGYFADIQGDIYAITIGPDSDVDEVFIIPGGMSDTSPPVVSPALANGHAQRQHLLHNDVIHVSVERPFVGLVKGPFRIFYPYAQAHNGDTTPRRWRPYDDQLWFQSAFGADVRRRYSMEVEFHDCAPMWLPTRRAPLKMPFRFPVFGNTGAAEGLADVDMLIPVMGRKRLQLGIEATGVTAGGGSLTWSATGLVVIENTDSSLQLSIAEALQADSVKSADFEETYAFDGEFDVLWLRIDETTALGAAVAVTGYVKAWDD